MPLYEMGSKGERMSIRLKVLQLVEQDIQDYGAIERSDLGLEARARYHVAQMQALLPTPQTILADEGEVFLAMVVHLYGIVYKGLLVGYTGLKDPYRLTLSPRYTTSVNLDGTEDEHAFTGFAGLQVLIKEAQDLRRKNALEDGCSLDEYLLTMIQVTIYDALEESLAAPNHFLCYDLVGDTITGAYAKTNVSDDLLRGLGLPIFEEGK